MNKNHLLTGAFLSLLLGFTACQNDDNGVTPDEVLEENRYVRVLVNDVTGNNLSLINPYRDSVAVFTAQFPGSNLYPTASGRFAALINYPNNYVQFFDSGIESHDDHAHVKGTPKWAVTTSDAPDPTHFYTHGNQIAVFNDGEGSLSLVSEDQLHTAQSAERVIVDVPHHGAAIIYDDGNFAVTEKDGTVEGTLPERVKIVNRQGIVIHTSTVATGGIHGDAGDGKVALFGSTSGILKVNNDGSQSLIPYPANFGENWLGTVYYGKASKQFIGIRSKFGAYVINPASNQITPLAESPNLQTARFDAEGKDVFVILRDGTLAVYDGATGTKKTERTLPLVFPEQGSNPTVTATKKFVYVTNPESGQVLMLDRSTLADYRTYNLSGKPASVIIIGADVDEEEND